MVYPAVRLLCGGRNTGVRHGPERESQFRKQFLLHGFRIQLAREAQRIGSHSRKGILLQAASGPVHLIAFDNPAEFGPRGERRLIRRWLLSGALSLCGFLCHWLESWIIVSMADCENCAVLQARIDNLLTLLQEQIAKLGDQTLKSPSWERRMRILKAVMNNDAPERGQLREDLVRAVADRDMSHIFHESLAIAVVAAHELGMTPEHLYKAVRPMWEAEHR